MTPSSQRFGYTTSQPVYVSGSTALGVRVTITSGSAQVYAGAPDATSHRVLASLSGGQSYQIAGVSASEIVSVQSSTAFSYTVASAAPPSADVAVTLSDSPDPVQVGQTLTYTISVRNNGPDTASAVTLTDTLPAGVSFVSATPSQGSCSGTSTLSCALGTLANTATATVTLRVNPTTTNTALANTASATTTTTDPTTNNNSATTTTTVQATTTTCSDPLSCQIVTSVTGYWKCDVSNCFGDPWVAELITWPSWAAYANNARTGFYSRTVYSASGAKLYPYMGAWADGCEVTAVTGTVLIVEWQRGTDQWRGTFIDPGETHVINLVGSEDNALIESADNAPQFSVRLRNCTPPPPDPAALASVDVTWTCTSAPCPWGSPLRNPAAEWPASMSPTTQQAGYTASRGVYLPASVAAGMTIRVVSGSAQVYAGTASETVHRVLRTLAAGQSYVVPTLGADQLISLQADFAFTYSYTLAGT
jgi:uncharacterized repeat protein (TIGR01451 family)